jgi:hypothetical protein
LTYELEGVGEVEEQAHVHLLIQSLILRTQTKRRTGEEVMSRGREGVVRLVVGMLLEM